MKTSAITLAVLLPTVAAACGPAADSAPMDAVSTAEALSQEEETRRVPQFENEHVLVWKSIIVPNQPLEMHRHDNPRAIIALKGGTLTQSPCAMPQAAAAASPLPSPLPSPGGSMASRIAQRRREVRRAMRAAQQQLHLDGRQLRVFACVATSWGCCRVLEPLHAVELDVANVRGGHAVLARDGHPTIDCQIS